MWVLGQKGALGIKRLCNGHGDVTAVSTGPPPVMDLGIKRPGLLGGPVERTTHRPRFGASPSLLCSSVTKKRTKCHEAVFFSGCLISSHSRGGANTHSGGEIGRRGEMREPTAPSVWRCPPRHHSLPAYCPQPTAKAIWPRCGSNLLRWRFANQAAPACYVASWANRTSGRPGNAHAAGAMAMEHAGCVENVR